MCSRKMFNSYPKYFTLKVIDLYIQESLFQKINFSRVLPCMHSMTQCSVMRTGKGFRRSMSLSRRMIPPKWVALDLVSSPSSTSLVSLEWRWSLAMFNPKNVLPTTSKLVILNNYLHFIPTWCGGGGYMNNSSSF